MQGSEDRLQEIFRGVFDLTADEVAAARQDNTATWDSMAHVSLVVAIEGEFGLTIDAGDSLGLTSYAAAKAYLVEQGQLP